MRARRAMIALLSLLAVGDSGEEEPMRWRSLYKVREVAFWEINPVAV